MTDERHDAEDRRTSKPRSPNGELRQLMERSLAENRRLRQAVVVLATSGRKHVGPDDFADVVTSDAWAEIDVPALHARADELEQQRSESSRTVLRNALIDAGVGEDGVDAALAQLVSGTAPSGNAEDIAPAETPQSRTAALGALGGRPASFDPRADEDRGLWGQDLITAAIQRESRG